MKRLFLILLSLAFCMSLTACSNKTSLSPEEKNVLKKPYSNLVIDEKVTFEKMIRKDSLTDDDIKNIKDYINQISDEELKKTFLKTLDHNERDAKGQLTDKEKEEEKKQSEQAKKAAEEFNNKVKKYTEAEKTIQENLDKLILNDKRFIDSTDKINVKEDNINEKFIITVTIYGMYDLRLGEVSAIRNIMVEEVQKVIKPNEIEVKFKIDNNNLDNYIFKEGTGWDKEVKSKK